MLSVLVAIGALAYFMLPKPMAWHAKRMLEAKLDGNTDVLYSYAFTEEKTQCGLTKENLGRVWANLVEPRLEQFQLHSPITAVTYASGAEGSASEVLHNNNGASLEVSASPWLTDDGPRASILENLMFSAWDADFVLKNKRYPTSDELPIVIRDGLVKDRPAMEALGLKGLLYIGGGSPEFVPFDLAIKRCEKLAAQSSPDSSSAKP